LSVGHNIERWWKYRMPMSVDLLTASDFELLDLSRTNDEAFAVFYRRYERLVVGWLMRRTGRPELVADLTAEVFAAAYLAAARDHGFLPTSDHENSPGR